jgi:hypothetical protein|tara:strand:- start:45 stop:437 length:393 start_codon:yes stop_codon:yes gene_type:complete
MVELEFVNEFRDYKLKLKYSKSCTCGSNLNLHMVNSSVNQMCADRYCGKQYEIKRYCSKCKSEYDFEDITCNNCEPEIVRIAELHMNIINSDKALKKINRAYKAGKINEADWKSGVLLYKETKERCERQL